MVNGDARKSTVISDTSEARIDKVETSFDPYCYIYVTYIFAWVVQL